MKSLIDYICEKPAGAIFSAVDFIDLGPRNTIDQTLSRLVKRGRIQKLAAGLFYIPKKHSLIGNVPPSIDDIAGAYAHKFGHQIQVSPAKAANLLGLSQQVPAKNVYLTDGPTRLLSFDGRKVMMKHVCAKKLLGIQTKAGMVIQALYYFKDTGLTNHMISKIKKIIDDKDKKLLARWLNLMPGWMHLIVSRDILNA